MNNLETSSESEEIRFLKFHYAEVKDLSKHFLTLITAVLTFSITMAEKFIEISTAAWYFKAAIVFCWFLFLCALASCGLGLYFIFLAGEQASGSIIYKYKDDFKKFSQKSYICLDTAGILFVIGMIVLALLGVSKIFS